MNFLGEGGTGGRSLGAAAPCPLEPPLTVTHIGRGDRVRARCKINSNPIRGAPMFLPIYLDLIGLYQ